MVFSFLQFRGHSSKNGIIAKKVVVVKCEEPRPLFRAVIATVKNKLLFLLSPVIICVSVCAFQLSWSPAVRVQLRDRSGTRWMDGWVQGHMEHDVPHARVVETLSTPAVQSCQDCKPREIFLELVMDSNISTEIELNGG